MKTLILFLTVSLFSVTEKNAQSQWIQTPGIPEGGGITDMVIAENGNLVVTTASFNWPNGQDGGVRWSSDEGATWNSPFNYFNARTLGLGQNGWIFCSAWDFPDTERLYASSDNGKTWPITLYSVGSNDNIFSILVRENNQTVYIGTRNGVLKSTNGGANFNSVNNGIPANSWVRDLESDSSGYLATATTNGVFISTNAGSLWEQATGISSDTIVTLYFDYYYNAVSDGDDVRLVGGSNNGKLVEAFRKTRYLTFSLLFLFEDEEVTQFGRYGVTNKNEQLYGVAVFPRVMNVDGAFYTSTDRGLTWTKDNEGFPSDPKPSSVTSGSDERSSVKLFCGFFENTNNGAKVFTREYTVGIQTISSEIPDEFLLEQNYPNPFNPETKINFSIKEKSFVRIAVYDALGKELDELVNEELTPGTYRTNFNSSGFDSGIYFYRLTTDKYSETKKMILIK